MQMKIPKDNYVKKIIFRLLKGGQFNYLVLLHLIFHKKLYNLFCFTKIGVLP